MEGYRATVGFATLDAPHPYTFVSFGGKVQQNSVANTNIGKIRGTWSARTTRMFLTRASSSSAPYLLPAFAPREALSTSDASGSTCGGSTTAEKSQTIFSVSHVSQMYSVRRHKIHTSHPSQTIYTHNVMFDNAHVCQLQYS